MKTTDVLAQEFRNAGLKITPQRLSVFDALHACDDHPTAEQVYQQVIQSIPSVSMRTVYQTLNDLVAMGELDALRNADEATRFDLRTDHHHHALCDVCGAVIDVDAHEINLAGFDIGDAGFRASRADVIIRGRCGSCADG